MTLPLMAGAMRLITLADNYPKEPVIERAVKYAENPYKLGEAVLAFYVRYGRYPSIRLTDAGYNAGKEVVIQLLAEKKKIKEYKGTVFGLEGHKRFKSKFKVVTHQSTARTMTTACDATGGYAGGMSENGRRQATAWRKKHGGGTGRSGVKIKRETCKPFDQRLPQHWWWT